MGVPELGAQSFPRSGFLEHFRRAFSKELTDLIDAETESNQRSNDRSDATSGHIVKVIREDQLRVAGQLAQFNLYAGEDLISMETIPRTPPPSQASSFFGPGLSSFARKLIPSSTKRGAIYHNRRKKTMQNADNAANDGNT
jgi:hypothetical protein